MLQMENIRKSYFNGKMSEEVLHGVNLNIEDGEMVAIMGASGSGKSTLLGILGCLDYATSGRYEMNGIEIDKRKDKKMNRLRNETIGFVFQKFHLFPNKTALENVMMPVYYNQSISNAEGEKRATEMLEKVNMGEKINELPIALSGGECQRIAIARALVMNPPVLFADEPTGNLDSKNSKDIMKLFSQIHEEFHNTMVIVPHDPGIGKACQRILMMHDGKITNDHYIP